MEEHQGIITFQGAPLTLLGRPAQKGRKAPDFLLLANDLSPRTLESYQGRVLVFSVVPSLDTGICDLQTRRFNEEAAHLDAKVRILAISCDLPFAQARWCGLAGADRLETLSDHRDLSFGLAYGVAIKELRLLARSLFVVNSAGLVTYAEIVPEVASEINFDAALAAVKAAL
jgi:thiol peroxidase